jgi:hypothetical protein
MTNYDIESKDFSISAQGLHLLRNKFNYKTINFDDVNKAYFARAAETRNVALALIVGILFVAFAIYSAICVYDDFHDPLVYHIHIESIMLPILPLLAGCYCIYIAVKKVPLLVVELKDQKYKLSIADVNAGRLYALESYLKEKLNTRFYIN